jgi:SAM-dependent methyltransferase
MLVNPPSHQALNDADSKHPFDPSVPHPARVYAYWLGGKDYYPADREAAEEVIRLRPQVVAGARANRQFLARLVRFLAGECGIRQFLDIGTGLPGPDNTHEVAHDVAPECRVVYVDNDPVVMAYARALLTSKVAGVCDYIEADVRDPAAIVRQASRALDFTQPAAVLLLALLHFVPDGGDPAGIVAALARALRPGSYIAISHLTADYAPAEVHAAAAAYNTVAPAPVAVTPRTHEQVTGLFGGLPLLEPGVVPVTGWRPTSPLPHRQPCDLYAGVARIPGDVAP